MHSANEYISVCKRLSIIDLVITSWKKKRRELSMWQAIKIYLVGSLVLHKYNR